MCLLLLDDGLRNFPKDFILSGMIPCPYICRSIKATHIFLLLQAFVLLICYASVIKN